jgi:hypothetical protein
VTGRRFEQMEASLRQLTDRMGQVEGHLDKMELVLTLREPGSTAAADAYEGLRKQIVAGVTDRLAHLSQLVQFDSALRNGATVEVLAEMVKSWMESAGLSTVERDGVEQRQLLFDVVEDLGGPAEVLEPSYVDAQSGRVIRLGRMRLGPLVESSVPAGSADSPAERPPTDEAAASELPGPDDPIGRSTG